MLATGRVVLLKYIDGRLYDMTRKRRLERLDGWTYRIRDHWKRGSTAPLMTDSELDGPVKNGLNSASFFPFSLGVDGDGRDTLVQVPGIVYSHPLPEIVFRKQAQDRGGAGFFRRRPCFR